MTREVCEICGKSVEKTVRARVDEAELRICPACLERLGRRAVVVREEKRETPPRQLTRQTSRARSVESLDLVEGYGDLVRRAREKRGLTVEALAQRLRVSAEVVRRIESEKYKPPIDLAKRIERVLGVKILVATEEEPLLEEKPYSRGATLGEVVVVRREEEERR
ncbi:MAG: multiprotein bridging factor aMBF1 [Acidilobaceae archaeon]